MTEHSSRRGFAIGLTAAAAASLVNSAWAASGAYEEDDIVQAAENFRQPGEARIERRRDLGGARRNCGGDRADGQHRDEK